MERLNRAVSSVNDSKGNIYRVAMGPNVTGSLSQAIYYARKISAAAAATNAVTVTFNTAATFPDVRIVEYCGIDPSQSGGHIRRGDRQQRH